MSLVKQKGGEKMKETRDCLIQIKVTKAEKEQIKKLAEKEMLSITNYIIRKCLLK